MALWFTFSRRLFEVRPKASPHLHLRDLAQFGLNYRAGTYSLESTLNIVIALNPRAGARMC
jgi:hypothetical protein